MVYFIDVLRALAACLITNAHYEGVYPTDWIANGGLLGDVLFFAVSGFCLANIKDRFPKWYGRRLVRCYLPVLLITALYTLLGFYDISQRGFVWWFVYPTNYHFIASIVPLYIPFYIVMKMGALKKNIPIVMGAVALVCICIYLFFYDKSYYHIDTVREPMIEFLFFEGMLMGALFRNKDADYRNQGKWHCLVGLSVSFICYFASKMLLSKGILPSSLQIINWMTLLTLLYFALRTFSGIDSKLEAMPRRLKTVISDLASITLEIYVVQYVIIDILRSLFGFPLNWFALTAAILISASVLRFLCKWILEIPTKLIGSGKEKA